MRCAEFHHGPLKRRPLWTARFLHSLGNHTMNTKGNKKRLNIKRLHGHGNSQEKFELGKCACGRHIFLRSPL